VPGQSCQGVPEIVNHVRIALYHPEEIISRKFLPAAVPCPPPESAFCKRMKQMGGPERPFDQSVLFCPDGVFALLYKQF
jgi:hypothetical protein